MLTQEQIEEHLKGLKAQEKMFLDNLLIVRGAIRNCEHILGLVQLKSDEGA